LKVITGISDRRAQKINKKMEEKGCPLTFEDLKLMSDTLNTIWNLLIQYREIILEQAEKEYREEKEKE
jgi:hypothetical protein